MNPCPYCQATDNQIKAGRTCAGSQRYQCKWCRRRYTPNQKDRGYPDEMRRQAVRLYADGMNFRQIARQLAVNHQTVINWINAYAASLPKRPPLPAEAAVIEQDELFTFVGDKKTRLM